LNYTFVASSALIKSCTPQLDANCRTKFLRVTCPASCNNLFWSIGLPEQCAWFQYTSSQFMCVVPTLVRISWPVQDHLKFQNFAHRFEFARRCS